MEALSKFDLDLLAARGCQSPGCDHAHHGPVFLHPRCHVQAGTWASYERGSGVLVIACKECRKTVAEIKVAE